MRYRMCQDDRDAYGGPEWQEFSWEAVAQLPFDRLMELEQQMQPVLPSLEALHTATNVKVVRKARIWLGRQLSGLAEPGFAEFNIHPYRVEFEDDANPPAQPSEQSSEG